MAAVRTKSEGAEERVPCRDTTGRGALPIHSVDSSIYLVRPHEQAALIGNSQPDNMIID